MVHALAARRAAIPHHVAADMGAPCLWMFPWWICHNLVTALHSVWLTLTLLAACLFCGLQDAAASRISKVADHHQSLLGQQANQLQGMWPNTSSVVSGQHPLHLWSPPSISQPPISCGLQANPNWHTQCIAASTSRCSMATTQCARWASTAALAAVVWTCLVHGA